MKLSKGTLGPVFVLILHSFAPSWRCVALPALWFAAALCSLASSALAQSRSETTFTPAPSHSSTSGGSSQDPSTTVVYRPLYTPSSGCGFAPSGPAGAAEARASQIDKKGPQEPAVFSMSSFTVMGFAKGNWPIVIDYLLEQDSLLIVVIAPEGSEPIIYRLNGRKGHWQNRLSLPAQLGDKPLVAQYAIRALDDTVGQIGPSHLHVHGIAAGPKAVGSIGIDRVDFSPPAISTEQGQKARYLFHSISDFKNVEVDFIRLAMFNNQIIAARVGGKSVGGVSKNTQKDGDWDGKSDGGGQAAKSYSPELQKWLRAPRGQHLVQVRGWWGAKDGGDWVTALSDDYVTVK
ncbi:MAG TPA: hypothetical protein VKA02_00985 [Candidatus Acidoferrum sp.]|nr:hypothetical protein [Candidatus Acidoferrum sp.]